MADGQVLEVSGLPSRHYDDDFIKDKLLLHFLRTRNGGGCDVTVRYLRKEEGVALLMFECEEVAKRILNRKHTLVIDDRTHPLEVRRPHRSQFSMPIKTCLDLSYFNNVLEIKRLLERHRLYICHETSSKVTIKGDFSDLRRCRQDLYKIISRLNPIEKHYSSQETTASKYLVSEEKDRRVPKNVPTQDWKSPSSSNLSRRRPEGRGHLDQDNVTRDHKNNRDGLIQHSSPRMSPQDSSTNVARSPTRAHKAFTPKPLSHSFLAENSVYSYITIFRQDMITTFRTQYNVVMSGKSNKGFTCITLDSLSAAQPELFEKICNQIKIKFDDYHNHLRVETIELPTSSRFSKKEITKKMQKYLFDHKIYSCPVANNSLDIIGPSELILTFLQNWKGTPGQLTQNILEGSSSPLPSTIGMDRKNITTNSKNAGQPREWDERLEGHEASHDAPVRGREQTQDGAGSRKTKTSANHTKRIWK